MKNGALLRAAAEHFDVFLTVDRNIMFQQNVKGLKIAVIVMVVNPRTRCLWASRKD